MATKIIKKTITVTTISGEILPKSKCRKIRGNYYKVGKVNIKDSGDCFRVPDIEGKVKYRTLETGAVIWDNAQKRYVHKSVYGKVKGIIGDSMLFGYITIDSKVVYGYDSSNGQKIIFKNEEIALLNNYEEKLSENIYYDKGSYSKSFFTEKLIPRSDYKTSLEYGCDRLITKATILYNNSFEIESPNLFIEELYIINKELFNNYTFGVEFETTRGVIPDHICQKLGLMPLRDGSISGIEYATIPLIGLKGLYTLHYALNELTKRTDFDLNCSMHVHVGGFKRDEDNILSLFKMMYCIQEDMYDLFPMYKKKNMGIKRQDYTSPLPNNVMMKMNYINKTIESKKEDLFHLIYFLSGYASGYETALLNSVNEHPYNVTNNRKWNMAARYLWFNLIPVIFTNKKTAEFRIFGMPNHPIKMFYFLLMSLALVDFSVKNSKMILEDNKNREKYSLIQILSRYKNQKLIEWCKRRVHYVRQLNISKGLLYDEKDIR